jgi:hypothetical protein
MDALSWAACASPIAYSRLPDGRHTFGVRATDPAGNTDATAATRTFTIDTSAAITPGAVSNPGGAAAPTSGAPFSRLLIAVSAKRPRLRTLISKGLKTTITCSQRCTVHVRLLLDRKTAKRLKLKRIVATRNARLGDDDATTVALKLTRKSKTALRRLRRARFVLEVSGTDVAGGQTTPVTQAISLRR